MDFDESESTVECPFCGEDFYDDVDQCPHCRQYISAADFKKRMPTWTVVIVILVVIAMLLPALAIVIRSMSGQ